MEHASLKEIEAAYRTASAPERIELLEELLTAARPGDLAKFTNLMRCSASLAGVAVELTRGFLLQA